MDVMIYAANAGDRNERGMLGALSLGVQIARWLDAEARTIGSPVAIVEGGWAEQLKAATPNLRLLERCIAEQLRDSGSFILTTGRCAAGIATLPPVASRYPDAAIVWFDAHGDCNVPTKD